MISRIWMVLAMVKCKISSPKWTQVLSLDFKGCRPGLSFRWWNDPCTQYVSVSLPSFYPYPPS